MRVIPKCSCIRRRALVDESLTGFYRSLAEPGSAIHRVGKPDAVPVYGRFLRQIVADNHANGLSLLHAQFRSRNAIAVAPDFGHRPGTTGEGPPAGAGVDLQLLRRSSGAANMPF